MATKIHIGDVFYYDQDTDTYRADGSIKITVTDIYLGDGDRVWYVVEVLAEGGPPFTDHYMRYMLPD